METLCTVLAIGHITEGPSVTQCLPLKEAIEAADALFAEYLTVRVYAETNNGATLTLIYQPS